MVSVRETFDRLKPLLEEYAFTKRFMERTPGEWEQLYDWLWHTYSLSNENVEKGAPLTVQLKVLDIDEDS